MTSAWSIPTAAGVAMGLFALGGVAWAFAKGGPRPSDPSRVSRGLPGAPGSGTATPGQQHPLHPALLEETALRLAETAVGQRYSWGGGGADSPWPQGAPGVHGGVGWDCSGLALSFSGLLLRYRWDGRDLTARGIADICAPINPGHQKPGDLAVYRNRHITAVLTHPGPGGRSRVLSASGGGQDTNGNDPNAVVRIHDRADYRGDFLTYARLPAVHVSDRQAVTAMAVHRLLRGDIPPVDSRLPASALRAELQARYAQLPVVAAWLRGSRAPVS